MKINKLTIAVSILFIISSCSKQQSSITGWDYNNSKNLRFLTNMNILTSPTKNLTDVDNFEHNNVCLYVLEKPAGEQHYRIITKNCQAHLTHLL